MKRLLLGCLFALAASVCGAAPTLVQSTSAHATGTTCVVMLSGVTANDTLIWHALGNSSQTFSSIADSSGNTVSAAQAWSVNGSPALGFGVYYVQAASAGTHTITLTVGGSEGITCIVSEWSGLATSGVFDVASSTKFTASSTSVSSNSVTPSANGELLIFAIGQEGSSLTYSSYNNSFIQQYNSAASPTAVAASEVQTTAAAISGAATSSLSGSYATVVAAFVPASGPTCTNAGVMQNGTKSVPNGSSGLYWGKTGNWVTPDCATVEYWQPSTLNWGVN